MCFGEVIWDLLPDGPCLGGAPANVAVHLAALGHQVSLVSRVGDDERGHRAVALLAARGVDTSHIQFDKDRPTGIIETHLVNGAPHYRRVEGCAWQNIVPSRGALEASARAEALYFGTLCQHYPSREALDQLMSHAPSTCVRVCDLNLRPPQLDPRVLRRSLLAAGILKLTRDEAQQVQELLSLTDLVEWIFENTQVELVALTQGPDGAALRTRFGFDEHSGFPAEAGGDDVGAGDAFTAVLTHGWLSGAEIGSTNRVANCYASFVASRAGAMPVIPDHLLRRVRSELWYQQ